MDNQELIQQWKAHHDKANELWKEVLARGLYFESQGLLSPKQWNCRKQFCKPLTLKEEREFWKNVRGGKRVPNERKKPMLKVSPEEAAEFV